MLNDPQYYPDSCQAKDSESFSPGQGSLDGRRGRKQLPLETRIVLFALVRDLRASGLSFGQLQRNLFEKTQVCLSKATISGWVRGTHDPLGRVNKFDAEPSPELAYIIGVVLGDGNLNVHEYHDEILLSVTDRDFASEFSRCLSKVLYKSRLYKVRWSENRKRWIVQGASIFLHKFLSHQWRELKPWIEHCNECTASFLRAFFDSEGCVSRRHLTVSNTNLELLLYLEKLLRIYGVQLRGPYLGTLSGTTLRDSRTLKLYKRKRNCYSSYVTVRTLPQFAEHIGFAIERKQKRLRAACT